MLKAEKMKGEDCDYNRNRKGWGKALIRYSVPIFFLLLMSGIGICQISIKKNAPHLQCGTPWGIYNFMAGPGFFHVSVVGRPGIAKRAYFDKDYWSVLFSTIPEENENLKKIVEEANQLRAPRKVGTHRHYVEYICRYIHAIFALGFLAVVSGGVVFFRGKGG